MLRGGEIYHSKRISGSHLCDLKNELTSTNADLMNRELTGYSNSRPSFRVMCNAGLSCSRKYILNHNKTRTLGEEVGPRSISISEFIINVECMSQLILDSNVGAKLDAHTEIVLSREEQMWHVN